MPLEPKYERAADLKLLEPERSWASIAQEIEVSERQLRRIRDTKEWHDYWQSEDKKSALETIRHQATVEANAALWRLYLEGTGQLDPDAEEALIKMSDEEFNREVAYIVAYGTHKDKASQVTDGISTTRV